MKFVLPNYASVDSFVDNVAFTLGAMGHDVRTLPAASNAWMSSPVRRIMRDAAQQLSPSSLPTEERWLLNVARAQRPDVVLSLTRPLSDETIAQLRRIGVRHIVAWWGDSPGNMTGRGLLSDGWDRIYLKDADAVAKFRLVGLPAELMHEAMNPHWHRPVSERNNDLVAIVGSFYNYRQFLTLRLIEAKVAVGLYGGRLPRWSSPEIRRRHTGRFLVRQEKSRVFGEALACLNSTAIIEGNSLNCRAFEIAGAGGLQLIEYRPAVAECFEPGKELLTFRTFDELLELIGWARENPMGANAVRQAGARRAAAEHTYEHRLSRIIRDFG